MTVSYEEARAEATDYLAEADLHLARTGRLPSIPLPADLLRALLSGPPEPMALSASDASCYAYPGEDQGPLRDAFVQGALSVRAGPPEPSDEARYAALGRACESNGLGWYVEGGTMRFQAPADIIEERALASRPAVAEGWVLVPREPTEAMINAAMEGGPSAATKAATNSLDRLVSLTVDIWTAFLSAAPKP